jgi:RND family efflux transporter MFP subunit
MKTEKNITPSDSPTRGYLRPILLIGLGLSLVGLALVGVLPRLAQTRALQEKSTHAQTAAVNVVQATRGQAEVELLLPSTVEPLVDTPIYARTNGYLKKYYADIGAKVEAGAVLAEIETPEIDEQLNQSRAALEQAQANLTLAETSNVRWQDLLRDQAVSKQEADERKAALAARQADLTAAEANVQRLTRLQSFQKVTAPYAGTIIARNVDTGALVSGDNNDRNRMLFRLAQTDTLRVYLDVPQNYYRLIAVGQTAQLSFREQPGKTFAGKIVRTSGALDPATRTLRTEVQVPNEQGQLVPGLYAEVKLKLPNENPPVLIPANALILLQDGPHVAQINESGRVRILPVTLGRDFGKTIEVVSGLDENARLVASPSDTLRDGALVEVNRPEKSPGESKKQLAQK